MTSLFATIPAEIQNLSDDAAEALLFAQGFVLGVAVFSVLLAIVLKIRRGSDYDIK